MGGSGRTLGAAPRRSHQPENSRRQKGKVSRSLSFFVWVWAGFCLGVFRVYFFKFNFAPCVVYVSSCALLAPSRCRPLETGLDSGSRVPS